ncbi:MAG: ATP-binding cassette domain-containing protein [Rickettsiales bacterium]|nr:ATP-binding cassette domain-containing protein [Rickettsiales bacterium]
MNLIDKFNLNDPVCKFRLNKFEVVLSTLAVNLLSLALPIMVLQVYDRIMINRSVGTLTVLAIGVSIAIILEGILRIARAYTTSWAGMMYEYTMAANAMRLYINANPVKLKKEGPGQQIQNLNAFSKLRDFYSGQTLINIVDIPFAFTFLVLISYLTGKLVIVPIALIAIFTIVTWFIGNKLKQALLNQGGVDDKRYNFIVEALQGIHTIKSLGLEAIFTRRYASLEEECSIHNYRTALISTQGYTFGILFNELMVVAIVSFGAPMVIKGDFTSGALVATVLLAGRLMQPIQKTLFLWTQFQEYRIANNQAEKMFSIEQVERRPIDNKEFKEIGTVKLENVSFGYGKKMIFENINLDLKIPDTIGIRGENNAGKATLMRLIAGIVKPTSGRIFVNGIPPSDYQSEELVKYIGYISANNILFQGTILENLTAFNENMENEALEIAKMFNLDKEIALLPKGYDTKINDGIADIIAPGIKQRIAISRALIHKPKIILFHNADRGLDKEGYNLLIKFLHLINNQTTTIIVTEDHNINLLVDREYLLKDGKLTVINSQDSRIYDLKPYKELKI